MMCDYVIYMIYNYNIPKLYCLSYVLCHSFKSMRATDHLMS